MTRVLSTQEVRSHIINGFDKKIQNKVALGRVITVIKGYGKRDGLFGWVPQIFYRIWNAVKAIFGQSDWQLAKEAMVTDYKEFGVKGFPERRSLPEKVQKDFEKMEINFSKSFIEVILTVCVDATYVTHFGANDQVSKYIEKKIDEKVKKLETNFAKDQEKLLKATLA